MLDSGDAADLFMHVKLLLAGAFLVLAPLSAKAYSVPPFEGNDTGGIIAWSPEAHRFRHAIAADHCARFGKIHRITSVHPWYGDYIGFACYWPRGYEPGAFIVRRAY
ncbi:MAG TPA: hypothetical protein VHG27_03035 [Xanthobacteraceae bacterium]|nr:hypothetical protein [Xanthobacteraceae bacterium]